MIGASVPIGGTVYIDARANRNMHTNMTLHVYRQVKQLIDPTTNAVLDTIFNKVGTIQVQSVSDKVSTCTVCTSNIFVAREVRFRI